MKSFKCLFIPLMLMLFICSSCSKEDDVTLTGNLELSFYNSSSELRVQIFTIENEQKPIYEFPMQGKTKINVPLNMGNYIIRPYTTSSSTFYASTGFQIVQGKTTSIIYDEHNDNSVTIKN